MAQGSGHEVVHGRRHIIRRPRLTRLLDETTARCVLLVAPAGYGKTTLAREWLSQGDRRSAWYQATPASADVAALAVGIANALATVVPSSERQLIDRLRITNDPEGEASELAELLSQQLPSWPRDAWVALDDYHFISEAAEPFISTLFDLTEINLLVAGRQRPTWVTARRLLYGDVVELGASTLAMNHEEANEVLMTGTGSRTAGLLALAQGWPAVIGLAAFADHSIVPESELPGALYDFFAEELFQSLPQQTRWDLCRLALLPNITPRLARRVLRRDPSTVIDSLVRLGILSRGALSTFELHPLLRTFLSSKLEIDLRADTAFRTAADALIAEHEWDAAFAIIATREFYDLLPHLISDALDTLLGQGRLSTLERWLASCAEVSDHPVVSLAAAEVAFRKGDPKRAELLGSLAVRTLDAASPLSSRAAYRAGQSAYYLERADIARTHFQQARRVAQTPSDEANAIWGELVMVVQQLEDPESERLLKEFEACRVATPEHQLRGAIATFMVECLSGDVSRSLGHFDRAMSRLPEARDPMVRTSFLNFYSRALSLQAEYRSAQQMALRVLEEAARFRLQFVRPHALCARAIAELGLRRFATAKRVLVRAQSDALEQDDVHNLIETHAILARLCLVTGDLDGAWRACEPEWSAAPAPGMLGEYLACRALVCAVNGRQDVAADLIGQVRATTSHSEALPLADFAEAIGALRASEERAESSVANAFRASKARGNLDAPLIVSAAVPEVASVLRSVRSFRMLEDRGVGMADQARSGASIGKALSEREQEVLTLISAGLSNREIARALFISESTTKVHVRHILRKLGVRSRVEAALRQAAEVES